MFYSNTAAYQRQVTDDNYGTDIIDRTRNGPVDIEEDRDNGVC